MTMDVPCIKSNEQNKRLMPPIATRLSPAGYQLWFQPAWKLQEVAQNQTCRIIPNCLRFTPAAVLEHEVDLFPFAMRCRQVAAVMAQ